MKFYNLKKSDFKKKCHEFQNTYFGSILFKRYAISLAMFALLGFVCIVSYVDCSKAVTMSDLANYIFYCILLLISAMMSVIFGIDYMHHIKDYVNNKK